MDQSIMTYHMYSTYLHSPMDGHTNKKNDQLLELDEFGSYGKVPRNDVEHTTRGHHNGNKDDEMVEVVDGPITDESTTDGDYG